MQITDWLLLALFGLTFSLLYSLLKQPVTKRSLLNAFSHSGYAASLITLTIFAVIGLLDAIHLPSAWLQSQEESILDLGLRGLKYSTEVTYSRPFALYGLTPEFVPVDGVLQEVMPRLTHAGQHLQSLANYPMDLIARLAACLLLGVIIGLAAATTAQNKGLKPVKTIGWTLGGWGIIIAILFLVAPYYHVLGTDKVGEDVLYQAIKSIRTAWVVGGVTLLIMIPLSTILGLLAGYQGGRTDDCIQFIYTTLSAVPAVLLIAASVLVLDVAMDRHLDWFQSIALRADARLLALCVVLGLTSWPGLCRIIRAEVLKLRQLAFVVAAKLMGTPSRTIVFKHLLPNVAHLILIAMALDFSGLVLAESVLTYVGVGVSPSTYSWGQMINGARLELAREPVVWWSLIAAFIWMFGMVLSMNLVADGVRDALDPRQQGGKRA